MDNHLKYTIQYKYMSLLHAMEMILSHSQLDRTTEFYYATYFDRA